MSAPSLTDRGVADMAGGLREVRAFVIRRRKEIVTQIAALEAEALALGKMQAAHEAAIELLRGEQAARENAA